MTNFFSNLRKVAQSWVIAAIWLAFSGFLLQAENHATSFNSHSDTLKIKIITTTDIHASVFYQGFPSLQQPVGGLSAVHSYVQKLRIRNNHPVILLDNGDLIQGHPTGYWFNFVNPADSNAFARIMNYMGYDAAVVGNHDIEGGPLVYHSLQNQFNFPYLGANVVDVLSGQPAFVPYTMIERNSIRIAVLGITTPAVPQWLPRKLWDDFAFAGMYETAQHWIGVIRKEEKPDAIIGLFHSGGGEETKYDGAGTENASYYVARNVPGFDVIFTGHDHRTRNTTIENIDGEKVLVVGTNSHARELAEVDLSFDVNPNGGYSFIHAKGAIVDLTGVMPDAQFMSRFRSEKLKVDEFLKQQVAFLDTTISSRSAYTGNSAFVDFIHQLQHQLTGAEISFAAPLSFDVTLHKGKFLMSHLFNLYPFENYLYMMTLTGEEIVNYLEFSYGLWFESYTDAASHVLAFRRDEEGNVILNEWGKARLDNPFYNFDSASGICYQVDISKPVGERITIDSMADGSNFDPSRTYSVAINSYRGSGGGGHLVKGAGIPEDELESRIVWVSERDMRSHIADLLNGGRWVPEAKNNWQIVPMGNALEKSLKRDLEILF